MSKDARLTIRMTDELDAWLGREADKRGLDKAAFARMALFERMNGAVPAAVVALAQAIDAQPARDVFDVASVPSEAPQSNGLSDIDIDAMVENGLAAADEAGLTAPPADEAPPQAAAGVRPLFRQPPPFSRALPSHLVGR